MRGFILGIVALVLTTATVGPAVSMAPAGFAESNYAYLLGVLRAEAARHHMEVPDLGLEVAQGQAFDSATGALVPVQIPGDAALRHVASALGSVDLAALGGPSTDLVGLPTMGVGDNAHGYASLRIFDCAARSYYNVKFQTPAAVPQVPTLAVPNPTFPAVPVAAAIVWGGPGFHATGGGWLVGGHIFVGAPIDVNVHTGGGGVSPTLAAGFDSHIDTLAVGRLATFTIPVTFWGFCLFSIDLGYILENGALRTDGGELIPGFLPI